MLGPENYATFVGEVFGPGPTTNKPRVPFPWQSELLEHVVAEGWPDVVDIPTGLGKTSAIDIAVYALATSLSQGRRDLPTRIFFVIDRRIVVDSAFAHAERVAQALRAPAGPVSAAVAAALQLRAGQDAAAPLEIVRMRGGATWGWRWLRQPDQPAVVVGTVDQYGSRLLFRGYGVGPRLRPIDAALCGTDALVLVDEAHLCGPMLETLEATQAYEAMAPESPLPERRARVVTLSATTRDVGGRAFELTPESWDRHLEHPVAGPRLRASKRVTLVSLDPARVKKRSQLATEMAQIARVLATEGGAGRVGVVANTVNGAREVFDQLRADDSWDVQLLVGRVRLFDRERIEAGVLSLAGPGARRRDDGDRPGIVVATQTVEVGADLSFDALVTEVAPLDALIQRFGRVARWGEPNVSNSVIVFAPTLHSDDRDPVYGPATARTWDLLVERAGEPVVLVGRERLSAALLRGHVDLGSSVRRDLTRGIDLTWYATPRPSAPVVLGPMLDAWARTEPAPMPDQPVAPFLHGLGGSTDSVLVCWRADLDAADAAKEEVWCRLVEEPAPRAHELVEVPRRELVALLAGDSVGQTITDAPVGVETREPASETGAPHVVYRGRGDCRFSERPGDIAAGDVVVVPSSLGGHDQFGWTGQSGDRVLDVAEAAGGPTAGRVLRLNAAILGQYVQAPESLLQLLTVWGDEDATRDDITAALKAVLDEIAVAQPLEGADETAVGKLKALVTGLLGDIEKLRVEDRSANSGSLGSEAQRSAGAGQPLVRRPSAGRQRDLDDVDDCDAASTSTLGGRVTLADHSTAVAQRAETIARRIGLSAPLVEAVRLGGLAHDVGKADPRFQAILFGNRWAAEAASESLAKSGRDQRHHAGPRFGWPTGMRHEALSGAAVTAWSASPGFPPGVDRELVVHLVTTHHGWCRPLPRPIIDQSFAPFEVTIPDTDAAIKLTGTEAQLDWDAPDRFARLTRRYGRWGLALLEAIVRLADMACSEEGT